jgi:YVTN family beta-propeller protein
MRLAPDGDSLWVLSRESRMLAQLNVERLETTARIRLPSAPADFDLAAHQVAISFPAEGSFAIIPYGAAQADRLIAAGPGVETVRFHAAGRQLWCCNRGNRTVTRFDTEKSRVVAHLPVAAEPENFCFKADGGELYVTGKGIDAVVVIEPYQTQVYETRPVGNAPGAMAISGAPDLLLVANTGSGSVTAMDITTGRVVAVVAVGAEPRQIAVTQDNQYAMTINSRSGDMAVIRIAALLNTSRAKTAPIPLFTMIRVGSKPVSAAIRPV